MNKIAQATLKALMSGAASGGVLGAGTKLVGGGRTLADIGGAAAKGAAIGGAGAAGSTWLGSHILGAPDDDDKAAYTHRGALGGAVGGVAAGSTLGALAARGTIQAPKDANLLFDYFRAMAKNPTKYKTLKGGLIGGLGLGALAAYQGGDEGMQLDAMNEEMRRRKRQQMGLDQ